MRTLDVVFGKKQKRVTKRVVDVTLSCKYNTVSILSLLKIWFKRSTDRYVALNEFHVCKVFDTLQILKTGAVVKFVEYDYLHARTKPVPIY